MNKISFLVFITLITFTSCKKYEEDKGIRFKTFDKRIYNKWKLTHYEINGIDSLEHQKFLTHYFEIKKSEFDNYGDGIHALNCFDSQNCYSSDFISLHKKPGIINTSLPPFLYKGNLNSSIYDDIPFWTIIKLSNKEMILEADKSIAFQNIKMKFTQL